MRDRPADMVLVPRAQRDAHVAAEWAALLVVVPALAWVAFNPRVPPAARAVAGAVALASLVIDGAFLASWYAQD